MTKTWYEVFKSNEEGGTETIFSDDNLENCLEVYRKEKRKDCSVKLDKWMDSPNLPFPRPIKAILN